MLLTGKPNHGAMPLLTGLVETSLTGMALYPGISSYGPQTQEKHGSRKMGTRKDKSWFWEKGKAGSGKMILNRDVINRKAGTWGLAAETGLVEPILAGLAVHPGISSHDFLDPHPKPG